jgi:hypothetical protein
VTGRHSIKTLALYTTIYPGVEQYLADWYRSVQEQTDTDYALWIGLDAVTADSAVQAMGGEPMAVTWVSAVPGETPAQVRQRALIRLVDTCDGVVLVDSDDILHPTRVASARELLGESDLVGCALRLVDQQGADLHTLFELPPQASAEDILPRNNVFGFSNSAYRSDVLRRCLPIPPDVALVDWYLATRAWLSGARLTFDGQVRMDYRQHGANMARVMQPFSAQQVVSDCELVRHHYQAVRAHFLEGAIDALAAEVEQAACDVEAFYRNVVVRPSRLQEYVQLLNNMELVPVWWSCIAHPSLKHLWIEQRNN